MDHGRETVNSRLENLQPYPFERLRQLCAQVMPSKDFNAIKLSIGEPRHEPPTAVMKALEKALPGVMKYPPTSGSTRLRESIAEWLTKRFSLPPQCVNAAANVLPVAGTREALFAIAQCVFDPQDKARRHVLMPNPFYQIYEGAALLAGGDPWFYNTLAAQDYQPDFDAVPANVWEHCQLLYLCTPGNPSVSYTHLTLPTTPYV